MEQTILDPWRLQTAGSGWVIMNRTAASLITTAAQNRGFCFDDFYVRYRNERGVSCLFFQNSWGQIKTSCTITTHSKGKLDEVGFLKCHTTEQPTSLCISHEKNMTGNQCRETRDFSFKQQYGTWIGIEQDAEKTDFGAEEPGLPSEAPAILTHSLRDTTQTVPFLWSRAVTQELIARQSDERMSAQCLVHYRCSTRVSSLSKKQTISIVNVFVRKFFFSPPFLL